MVRNVTTKHNSVTRLLKNNLLELLAGYALTH